MKVAATSLILAWNIAPFKACIGYTKQFTMFFLFTQTLI